MMHQMPPLMKTPTEPSVENQNYQRKMKTIIMIPVISALVCLLGFVELAKTKKAWLC